MTRARWWGIWIGVGVMILWLFLQCFAIFFHAGGGFFRSLTWIILPPAWVSGRPLSYHRVVETAHAFVALGVSPSYQEAFPSALSFVIRDARMRELLGETSLSDHAIFSDEDKRILEHARITPSEQRAYLELPMLRMQSADTLRNTLQASQEFRVKNVEEKLALGMPFSDVARYFSEDSSAMYGGDLGSFYREELPEWAQEVFDLQVGDVRSGIVGSDAFWLLRVEDRGGRGADAWVHLLGIAINKPTISAVLRGHAAEHPAWIFVW